MNFLVLGTVLDSEYFHYNLAANPASTKWLQGLVLGLNSVEAQVALCGHCYAQAWPRGPLLPGRSDFLWDGCENHLVKFLNFPGIRFRSMSRAYFKESCSVISKRRFDAIVTYNPYPWHATAARKLRKKYSIPWICLNLDFDDVGERWANFIRDAGDADGHLFLSHWGYEHAPVEQKIHLDSGITEIPAGFGSPGTTDECTIVYLGKLSQGGGIEVLLQLPELIALQNVKFVYGGKGYPDVDAKLKALAQRDSRVEYLGFVDEADVPALFERASIFLNPRDPADVVNDMVFPSKIMEYLRHGKTVVSTWTKGLDPVYRDLMLIAESPSARDFAATINVAVQESQKQRLERSQRISEFIKESRLWSKQASRFCQFATTVINAHQS